MENNATQNFGQSNRNLQLDKKDKKNIEQEGYVDDSDFGPEVVKRSPNLVDTDLDDDSDDDYQNDLDDDENNE